MEYYEEFIQEVESKLGVQLSFREKRILKDYINLHVKPVIPSYRIIYGNQSYLG